MADNNTVARPYAQAAFDVAQQSNAIGEVHASLVVARELMGDGRVAKFLGLPSLTDTQRLSFLQGLFVEAEGADSVFGGRSEHGTNFLKILLENDRVGVLPEIADHFDALKADVITSYSIHYTKLYDAAHQRSAH